MINLLQKTTLLEISAAIEEQVKRIQTVYGKRMEMAKARVAGTTTENASLSATTPMPTSAMTIAKTGIPAGMHPEQVSITDGPIDGNARVSTTSDTSTPTTTVVRRDTTVDNVSKQSTSATNVTEDTAGANTNSHHGSIPLGRSTHAVAEAQTFTTEPSITPTI